MENLWAVGGAVVETKPISTLVAMKNADESVKAEYQENERKIVKALTDSINTDRKLMYKDLAELTDNYSKNENNLFDVLLPQMRLLQEVNLVLNTMPNVVLPSLSNLLTDLVARTEQSLDRIQRVGDQNVVHDTLGVYKVDSLPTTVPYKPLHGGSLSGGEENPLFAGGAKKSDSESCSKSESKTKSKPKSKTKESTASKKKHRSRAVSRSL